MSNYDPDAYWCFDRKPVSLSDYGWVPMDTYDPAYYRLSATDSAGLTFGPAAGPEANDPDAYATENGLWFIVCSIGRTGDVDGLAGRVLS